MGTNSIYTKLIIPILIITVLCILHLGVPYASNFETITIYPLADSYVDSTHIYDNYGGSDSLEVHHLKYEGLIDSISNAYLLFDLSFFDPNVIIESSTLVIYAHIGPTIRSYVHFCSGSNWNEFEINWQNAPIYDENHIGTALMIRSGEFYHVNVKEAIANALAEGIDKLTLVITAEETESSRYISIISRETIKGEWRPRLEIAFSDGLSTSATLTTASLSPDTTSSTYSIEQVTVTKTVSETMHEIAYVKVTEKTLNTLIFIPIIFALGLGLGLIIMHLKYRNISHRKLDSTNRCNGNQSVLYRSD